MLVNDLLPSSDEETATQTLHVMRYSGAYSGFLQTTFYNKPCSKFIFISHGSLSLVC